MGISEASGVGWVVFWPLCKLGGMRQIQICIGKLQLGIAAGGRLGGRMWPNVDAGVFSPEARSLGFSGSQWASLEGFKERMNWGWVE